MDEIKNKFISKELFTKEELEEFIKFKIKEDKIEKYIENIDINNNAYSGYNRIDCNITINPNEILYERKDKRIPSLDDLISKKERKTNFVCDLSNPNLYNLYVINHELTHAYQELIFEEKKFNDNFSKYRLMLIERSVCYEGIDEEYFKQFYYKNYHDYFFSEYDANINSYINTLRFINSLDVEEIKGNIEKFNELVAKNLLYLYRNIERKMRKSSPYDNYSIIEGAINKSLIKSDIDVPNLHFDIYDDLTIPSSEYDKLKLGLPLNKDVLRYLGMVKNKKHKTLNLFNDIKNI